MLHNITQLILCLVIVYFAVGFGMAVERSEVARNKIKKDYYATRAVLCALITLIASAGVVVS